MSNQLKLNCDQNVDEEMHDENDADHCQLLENYQHLSDHRCLKQ